MLDAKTEFTITRHLITRMINRRKFNLSETPIHNGRKTLHFGQMKKSERQNEVIVKLPEQLKNNGN
jgi:hypothetical protein